MWVLFSQVWGAVEASVGGDLDKYLAQLKQVHFCLECERLLRDAESAEKENESHHSRSFRTRMPRLCDAALQRTAT